MRVWKVEIKTVNSELLCAFIIEIYGDWTKNVRLIIAISGKASCKYKIASCCYGYTQPVPLLALIKKSQ